MQLEYRKVWKQILKQNYQDCLDSPIRDSLNIGLLEIEENGKLEKMRQKQREEKYSECGICWFFLSCSTES